MYTWNWSVISDHSGIFVDGMLVTLWLTLLSACFGTALGTSLGPLRRSRLPFLAPASGVFIELFRALPILVLLIWMQYVLPLFVPWRMGAFATAAVALSLNLAAFVAETVRAGIDAIPKHQFESGRVLGLSSVQIMTRIVLPQALRNMLPNLMGLYVTQLKNSSLASIIAVNELLHRANILISDTFRPLEIYTAVAVAYLLMILPCTALARVVERKLEMRGSP